MEAMKQIQQKWNTRKWTTNWRLFGYDGREGGLKAMTRECEKMDNIWI